MSMSPETDPLLASHRREATVPVLEERPVVSCTTQQTGAVRVRIVSEDAPRQLELPVQREDVVVERVAPSQPAYGEPRGPWQDGEVLVVPVYEEQVVVERRWVLREEVRLHRRHHTAPHTETVMLRREHAVVERQQPDGSWQPVDLDTASAGGQAL